MAFADSIRSATATFEQTATLIESVFSSGYPATWTSYTPGSWTQPGAMTFSTVTVNKYKYILVGKLFIALVDVSGTTGGSAENYISVPLPITNAGTYSCEFHGQTVDTNTRGGGFGAYGSTTAIRIYKQDFTSWGLGAGRAFSGVIMAEVA